jgi:predicted small lipoprotein YifL
MHDAGSIRVALMITLLAVLAGCGQKGPLYLPDKAGDVVTRPEQTPVPAEKSEAPNTPGTVDSPQGPDNPAPEVTAPEPDKDKDKKEQGNSPPR